MLSFNRGIKYKDVLINSDELENIKSGRKYSKKPLITELYFNNQKLFYDYGDASFYLSVIDDDYSVSNSSIKYPESDVSIAIIEDTANKDKIANNIHDRIIAYSDAEYYIYDLVYTTLPLMDINVSGDNESPSDHDKKMNLSIYDNDADIIVRYREYEGTVRLRGGSTLKYPKKAFRLKLEINDIGVEKSKEEQISLLGIKEGKDYVLYPAYNDLEKIRNVFSSRLWYDGCAKNNVFGVNNGFYYRYVELFLNGHYWGLYALGYQPDEDTEELNKDDAEENIYKKISWDDELESYIYGDIGFPGYEIKSNEDEYNAWMPLKEFYYNLFENNDKETLLKIADLDNSIDIMLFFSLIQGTDGPNGYHMKNVLMINKKYNSENKMIYAPWDMDISWGNVWNSGSFNFTMDYHLSYDDNITMMYNNIVHYLLMDGDEETAEKTLNRYKELRNSKWSDENVSSILDEYEKDIFDSGAYLRDKDCWPNGSYENPAIKLNNYRKYVKSRLHYFDSHVEELVNNEIGR